MDEPFDIPVSYNGQEFAFAARLLQTGYTHKFAVDVAGQELFFEPDEEQNYRAVIEPEQIENKKVDIELLKAVAEAIESILK